MLGKNSNVDVSDDLNYDILSFGMSDYSKNVTPLLGGVKTTPATFFASNSGFARFFLVQHSKTGGHLPNYNKIYQMAVKLTKWP
jgi:hypothetical protein